MCYTEPLHSIEVEATMAKYAPGDKHFLSFEDGGFVLDGKPIVARRRCAALRVGCFHVSAAAWEELKALMNGEAR